MKARAVDFICYSVKDFKKALEFYRDTLGLPVSEMFGEGFAEFDLGNVTLAIGSAEMMGEKIDKPQGNATVGISVDDVKATMKELKAKGVKISEEMHDFPGCMMAKITDPDGNTIMIHHRKDGTYG